MSKYKENDVQIVRTAKAGDKGHVSGQDQVLIRYLAGANQGGEEAVLRKEVTEGTPDPARGEADAGT